MPKTPAEMIEAVTRNLKKNTGKTHEEWQKVVRAAKIAEPEKLYAWLRTKHGLGHVAARILSGQMKPYDAPDKLVDGQYAGERARLRPVYEAVLRAAKKLGKDVTPRPCKTYVPLHRGKTFAVVQPTTAKRVDLGLCLGPSVRPSGRLVPSNNLGSDRVTHKIELGSPRDVDGEVARWLKAAYEQA